MRVIEVERRQVDAKDLARQQAPEMEPNDELSGPCVLVDGDGSVLAAIGRLDRTAMGGARLAAMEYSRHASTTYRSSGVRNRSRAFAFLSPSVTMRRDGCRACNGAMEAPEAHAALCGYASNLDGIVAELAPGQHDRAHELAEAIDPEWRIGGTPWTSGVLNVDSAMPYHRDGNNLDGVWSAMLVVRRGVEGGHLHLPELDVVLPLRDGDVLAFPGADLWHAVTPITKREPDGYRLTAVFYCVAAMRGCGAPCDEAERTAAKRTAREEGIAAGLTRPDTERPAERAAELEVAVPSHARDVPTTLRLLAERGLARDQVRLFVTPDQLDAYRERTDPGLCAEVVPGAYGLAAQRAAIAAFYPEGTRLVQMDDDVGDLRRRVDDKTHEPIEDLASFMAWAFDTTEQAGAGMWGIYPVLNPKFMKDRTRAGLLFLLGQVWGVINSHDPELTVDLDQKEDYERTLRWWRRDGRVVRIENVAPKSRMYAAGGMQAEDQPDRSKLNEAAVDRLVAAWPDNVRVASRVGKVGRELRLVGPKPVDIAPGFAKILLRPLSPES